MGKNKIYTELDSNSITDLLSELPIYSKEGDFIEEGFFLNKPFKKFKVIEKDEDIIYEKANKILNQFYIQATSIGLHINSEKTQFFVQNKNFYGNI